MGVDNALDEDDPRNPACIADNVGDNAGMGADLFGSFAESTCAALVIASASEIKHDFNAMMFPLLLSAGGIVSGIITLLICDNVYPVAKLPDVEKALKGVLVISTVLETPFIYLTAALSLPDSFKMGELQASPLVACIP